MKDKFAGLWKGMVLAMKYDGDLFEHHEKGAMTTMPTHTLSLDGDWKLRIIGENIFGIGEGQIPAKVPGSVYGTLLSEGLMPDPYYRDNELNALTLMSNDFEYEKDFAVGQETLAADAVYLRFDGIDTLADIYLNGAFIAHADNMHRAWEFRCEHLLHIGENRLTVKLSSPVNFIRRKNAEVFAGGSWDSMLGYPHIRKAACMFGWDWGPRLPDAGIYRPVSLRSCRAARFHSIYVTQTHASPNPKVTLSFDVAAELFADAEDVFLEISVLSPEMAEVGRVSTLLDELNDDPAITIDDPQLWWPSGLGAQPLYTIKARLVASGLCLDTWERRIGLRTLTVNQDPDEWGERFAHEINGVQVFAMGADYIPEDNILSRVTPERTRRLLEDAVLAHYNTVRVWGGGYYLDDFFYDICDELGLIVWQDFMFACASYELDDDFDANIRAEARDVIRRLRHHACLGLWCGNNEMEEQMIHKSWRPSIKQKYDYIKIFEYIIPRILKEEDPQTFYWPSSPSSGGNYDEPRDENRGDAHYWGVWHAGEPFVNYRKHFFRYLSEFGFQSFPAMKTIEAFTEPGDRNIFSYVMEMHQRHVAANGRIMNYLSATYLYPASFSTLIYASQLLQAEAMRYAIEHNRRHRGRCMGTVVWQLNDIWPVASWSSIDYFGRWKALHYIEKRAFSPIMISCEEKGEVNERPYPVNEPAPYEQSFRLHVANETMSEIKGTVRYALKDAGGALLPHPQTGQTASGEKAVTVPALDGAWLEKVDLSGYDGREMHLEYAFLIEGEAVSSGSCLFAPPKYYGFRDPKLSYRVEGKTITVMSQAYAKNVEIMGLDGDVILSDNYFDMEPGEASVEVLRGEATEFGIRSVWEIR